MFRSIVLVALLCASATALGEDLTRWERFRSGGHPDYATEDSLDMHVAWCVWHEAKPTMYRLQSDRVRHFREFAQDCQRKNGHAKGMINAASDAEIDASLEKLIAYFNEPENGGYKLMSEQLCKAVAQRPEFFRRAISPSTVWTWYAIESVYRGSGLGRHVLNLMSAITSKTGVVIIEKCLIDNAGAG